MAYIRKVHKHGVVIERIEYQNGRLGQKDAEYIRTGGATPERVKKYKLKQLVKKTWRLLDWNFGHEDMWCTFTFTRENRPETNEQAKDIIKRFLGALRRLYKKHDLQLKYILSCGRGSKGGIHFHMVLSHFPDWSKIAELWAKYANGGDYVRTNFTPLEKRKNYKKLAEYLVKNGQEDFDKLHESVFGKRVSYSQNLVSHEPKRQKISAKFWGKRPPAIKGYYIDQDLSYEGTDINGYPYRYTVYIQLDEGKQEKVRCQLSNRRI